MSMPFCRKKLEKCLSRFWNAPVYIRIQKREEFIEEYFAWTKEKKYHQSRSKAEAVYELASSGIPTLSSGTPSTKMFVQEAVSTLRAVDSSLTNILTRMKELAKSLPEYSTVREMGGVGDVLAVKLIAEIGGMICFGSRTDLKISLFKSFATGNMRYAIISLIRIFTTLFSFLPVLLQITDNI